MTTYRVHFNHAGESTTVQADGYQITEGAIVFTGEDQPDVVVSLHSLSYFHELTVD